MMQKCLAFLAACLLLATLNTPLHGYIYGNESPGAYGTPKTMSVSLNDLVIRGAGFFMNGYRDSVALLSLLETGELTGFDGLGAKELAARAAENMRLAYSTYSELVRLADVTPYNPFVIDLLAKFDYDAFQDKYNLIADVFNEVKTLLKKGNVRGVYYRFLSDSAVLAEKLEQSAVLLEQGALPAETTLWEINQTAIRSFMFGQYVSQVFYAIK